MVWLGSTWMPKVTSRSGWGNGNGLSIAWCSSANTAVIVATPNASVNVARMR